MKLSFQRAPVKNGLRMPQPSVLPAKPDLSVSARYKGSRIGGDYYDFFPITDTRMIFMLTDVAGKREEALHIAAAVQEKMRERAPELLANPDTNVAEGVTELVLELNRTIMQTAGGVRSAPTFLGCLDEQFGLIHYVSAGHTPAFIKSAGEVTQLDPNGLPLGLFSHATHDAQVSVAHPGSAVVLVSKGLVETPGRRQEFGVERVRAALEEQSFTCAHDVCHDLLERAMSFSEQPSSFGPHLSLPGFRSVTQPNDQTVVCLMRLSQPAAETLSASA